MPEPETPPIHPYPSQGPFLKLLVTKHGPCAECSSRMISLRPHINAGCGCYYYPAPLQMKCTEATEIK